MSDNAFPTAPLWRRIAAIVYDSFLVIAIWIIVGFIVLSFFGIEEARTVDGEVVVLDALYKNTLFASMLVSAVLFFGWFWTHSGQTLGMQAWRIRVANADGSAINWRQCALRFVVAPPALALAGIGYWWALFDTAGRSWPDIVSGSRLHRVHL